MKRIISFTLMLMLMASAAHAELTWSTAGWYPTVPSTWNSTTTNIIGLNGSSGWVQVDDVTGGSGYPGTNFTWGNLYLGWHVGNTGTVTVTGAGASLSVTNLMNNFSEQNGGTGVVDVLNGGTMNVTGSVQVGNQSNDVCTITVDNATFNTTAASITKIGIQGTASAAIQNGAVWNDTGGTHWLVGNGASSNGSVTVDNSTLNTSATTSQVGGAGTGLVTMKNGAVWNTAGERWIFGGSNGSSGTFSIESTGGTVNANPSLGFIFGNAEGSNATISLDGPSSSINYTSDAAGYFGHIGNANLTLSNGSSADFTGDPSDPAAVTLGTWGSSDSSVTLTGGSELLVGQHFRIANGNKSSTMDVQSGSDVTIGGMISLGDGTRMNDSTCRGVDTSVSAADQLHATVTVTGAGSTISTGSGFYLAALPDKNSYPNSIETVDLNIDNGGVVTVGSKTLVGQGTAAIDATLDFDGGTLNTKSLGADMANITGTGTINTKGIVANTALSIASAGDLTQTLSNGGSVTINLDIDGTGDMGAGYDGTGSLTISGGVSVASTGGMLGHCMGANGTATVTGSGTVWEATETLSVGGMGAGTLNIKDGAMVKAAGLIIDSDVAAAAAGEFNDFYYYTGYQGFYFGDVADQFNVTTDSIVKISNEGQLALPGNLTIGMNANDVLTAIQGSDEIEIMDASGVWVDLSSAVRNTDYTLVYDSGMGYTILTVVEQDATPGDANKDGKVDSSDLGLLANNWQAGVPSGDPSVTWGMGDFNGDFKVDSSDLGLLANYWQFGVDMGAPNVVPEPSMVILLLGAMLVGWALRKK